MSAHTPGPWFYDDGDGGRYFPHVTLGGDGGKGRDYITINSCRGRNGGEMEELNANARLIAAAPDLLAACVALVGRVEVLATSPNREQALDLARAAIAKARGACVPEEF